MHVMDMHGYEARWVCDGCARTTWVPFVCAMDAQPPKAWSQEPARDLCTSCAWSLIVLSLLGPAHIEHMPEVSA